MEIGLISYASGNFLSAIERLDGTARSIGVSGSILHKNFRNPINKGDGLWRWKPRIIREALLNEDNSVDYYIYADSTIIFRKPLANFVAEVCEATEFQPIIGFSLPLLEREWTRPDVYKHFGLSENTFPNQIHASYFFIKNDKRALEFIEEWYELCSKPELIVDTEGFSHRHDQSLFSCLYKKFGFLAVKDISQYADFPRMYRHHSSLIEPRWQVDHNHTNLLFHCRSDSVFKVKKSILKHKVYETVSYYCK